MKLKELNFTPDEMAVVGDALNMHRKHLETGGYSSPKIDWLKVQSSVERKFVNAGLVAYIDNEVRRRSTGGK